MRLGGGVLAPGEAVLGAGRGVPGGGLLPLGLGGQPAAGPAGVGVGLVPADVLHRLGVGQRLEAAEAAAQPGAALADPERGSALAGLAAPRPALLAPQPLVVVAAGLDEGPVGGVGDRHRVDAEGRQVHLVGRPLVVVGPRVGRRAHRERAGRDHAPRWSGPGRRARRARRRRAAPGCRGAAGGWPASSRRAGARAGGPCRRRSRRRAAVRRPRAASCRGRRGPCGGPGRCRRRPPRGAASAAAAGRRGGARTRRRSSRSPGASHRCRGLAEQPQLLVVADVGEVPDQRRHQRRVLGEQLVVVEHGRGQPEGPVAHRARARRRRTA